MLTLHLSLKCQPLLGLNQSHELVVRTVAQSLPTLWQYDPFETDPAEKFSDHPWHSAEFLFSTAEQWNFWDALLGAQGFDLK